VTNSFPAHYSSLAPFRELFGTGLPILTYHKLGPRPHGARLKGLYVSADLFAKQLAELKAGGFTSQSLDVPLSLSKNVKRSLILTFDDGFANVLAHGITPLAANGFRAIQFLVADRIGQGNEWDRSVGEVMEPLMDRAQIKEWLAAGHQIGSHTLTHPFLTQIPMENAREEIVSSKKKLEDSFGVSIQHFCYPYGDWNESVRDLVIEAGYATACTTDYGVNTETNRLHALKRITARYATRSLRGLLQRWRTSAWSCDPRNTRNDAKKSAPPEKA